MSLTIFSISFFAIIFYLNKKSKSDYFLKSESTIVYEFGLIEELYRGFGYSNKTIRDTREAFMYFIDNPREYNGTSVINDRYMIAKVEPQSVKHDFLWITAINLKDLLMSNYEYSNELRKVNVNWFYCWVLIFIPLNIASIFKSLKFIKI